jgi:hypothetical protein
MSTQERPNETDDSRRKVIIVVAVIAAIAIAGLFYFLMRASSRGPAEPALAGAIHAGAPEFAEYQPKIVLDSPEADEAHRVVGDIWMNLRTTARNFTGRALNGLEIKASVVDHQGKPVKERTVVVLPNDRQAELAPNKTMLVQVPLEGLTDKDDRANIKMEVVGFRFK